MASITIHVEGLDELGQMLSQIQPKLAQKLMRKAMRAGGNVLKNEVISRCPVNPVTPTEGSTALAPGALRDSITTRVGMQPTTATAQAYVGPSKDTGYVGKFVEYGHALVRGSRRGGQKVIGQVAPAPFMRPALAAQANNAVQAVADSLEENLEGLV